MTINKWLKILALGFAMLGPASCGDSNPTTTVTATAREIRGRVTTRRPPGRTITRVVAVDVKTRRIVATATPDAMGAFVLTNVTKGRAYRIVAMLGKTPRPITFPAAAGRPGKTNVFKMTPKACGRAQCDDAPVDMGELTDDGTDIGTTPENSPQQFQDSDGDGMPDAVDNDLDGDGMPNAMDRDDDNNGMPDVGDPAAAQGMHTPGEYGDSDGDGLTDEADPDADGDGMANSVDSDDDGDGTPDAMEADTDNDGVPNAMDDDADGDGAPNADDTDANGDGDIDMQYAMDRDGDGTPDAMDPDVDGDGVPNEMDGDVDNDGVANEMDMDDNNDSMPDMPMM